MWKPEMGAIPESTAGNPMDFHGIVMDFSINQQRMKIICENPWSLFLNYFFPVDRWFYGKVSTQWGRSTSRLIVTNSKVRWKSLFLLKRTWLIRKENYVSSHEQSRFLQIINFWILILAIKYLYALGDVRVSGKMANRIDLRQNCDHLGWPWDALDLEKSVWPRLEILKCEFELKFLVSACVIFSRSIFFLHRIRIYRKRSREMLIGTLVVVA